MEVGDRVIYANFNLDYYTGENNPLVGTEYFCEGTIAFLNTPGSDFYCRVVWDNGEGNSYRKEDLELVNREPDWEV